MRPSMIAAAVAGLIALAVALVVLLDDGGESADPEPAAVETEPPIPVEPDGGPGDGAGPPKTPEEGAEGPSQAELEQRAARAARRSYRRYLEAIDARDGETVCATLAPGFLAELRPPRKRGSCAERISSSIGFEDPRGFPVWEETTLSGIERIAVAADNDAARITAAIVTSFRDREQPSVESDIAYLARRDGSWVLLKPTGALWRAVGKPEPPPSVISPPPGFSLSG